MHKPKSNKIKREEKLKKESQRRHQAAQSSQTPSALKKKAEEKKAYADYVLSRAKSGTRNPKETLKAIYNKEKVSLPATSPLNFYNKMFAHVELRDRTPLYNFLSYCVDQGVHFVGEKFLNGVLGLVRFHEFWIRPLEDWIPSSYNINRQFSSLARHLFAKYSIPVFMDNAFYSGNALYQDWFIHVGAGQNIRTAPGLPIRLTKMAAHHMMQAPGDFDIPAAIRWGQVRSIGGDERLIRGFLKSRMGTTFVNNEFWESVIRWFIDNPMLDTNLYAPIIDYLNYQKFVPSMPNPSLEGPRIIPAQPNLSMKRRSVEATIKGMEEWHRITGRNQRNPGAKYWSGSGIAEFQHEEANKIYTIVELLSQKELLEEGMAMRHCVGSYSNSCSTGRISIWSMRDSGNRMLTIEVDNLTRTIRQARGAYNQKPSYKASDVMNRWAVAAGLNISKWLI